MKEAFINLILITQIVKLFYCFVLMLILNYDYYVCFILLEI